jgi:hypothetical protein
VEPLRRPHVAPAVKLLSAIAADAVFDLEKASKITGYMTLLCGDASIVEGDGVDYKYTLYPAIKIARLAVDRRYQDLKIGSRLVDREKCGFSGRRVSVRRRGFEKISGRVLPRGGLHHARHRDKPSSGRARAVRRSAEDPTRLSRRHPPAPLPLAAFSPISPAHPTGESLPAPASRGRSGGRVSGPQ